MLSYSNQSFPIFITGYPKNLPTAEVESNLERIYSPDTCKVKANAKGFCHVHFKTFEAAFEALSYPGGVTFDRRPLRQAASFDTLWACHVRDYVATKGPLPFREAQLMASAGVGSGMKYHPQNFLTSLRRVLCLHIDDASKEIRFRDSLPLLAKTPAASTPDAKPAPTAADLLPKSSTWGKPQAQTSVEQRPSSPAAMSSASTASVAEEAATVLPLETRCARAEKSLWGEEKSGALKQRIKQLEKGLLGKGPARGGLSARLHRIEAVIGR